MASESCLTPFVLHSLRLCSNETTYSSDIVDGRNAAPPLGLNAANNGINHLSAGAGFGNYPQYECVVVFFRGRILWWSVSDTPPAQDVSSSQGSTRNFLNKFLIGILRGAAFATWQYWSYWWYCQEDLLIRKSWTFWSSRFVAVWQRYGDVWTVSVSSILIHFKSCPGATKQGMVYKGKSFKNGWFGGSSIYGHFYINTLAFSPHFISNYSYGSSVRSLWPNVRSSTAARWRSRTGETREGVSMAMGVSKNGWFIVEDLTEIDDWEVPPF